jgi:hypothetical protein
MSGKRVGSLHWRLELVLPARNDSFPKGQLWSMDRPNLRHQNIILIYWYVYFLLQSGVVDPDPAFQVNIRISK